MTTHVRQSKTRKMRDRVLRRGTRGKPPLMQCLADLPRAQCVTPEKVRYRSRKAAESCAEKQWAAERRVLRAYVCADHWHLTSKGVNSSGKVKGTPHAVEPLHLVP